MQAWYDEVQHFSFPYPQECNPYCPYRCSGPVCTHYTQVHTHSLHSLHTYFMFKHNTRINHSVYDLRWRIFSKNCGVQKVQSVCIIFSSVCFYSLIKCWYKVCDERFGCFHISPNTHLTVCLQLVWATSNKIGCAINVCYNMNVWGMIWAKAVYLVCNYSPP